MIINYEKLLKIQFKLGIPVVLSKTHILFGIDLQKCNSAINLIKLLSKFYILE